MCRKARFPEVFIRQSRKVGSDEQKHNAGPGPALLPTHHDCRGEAYERMSTSLVSRRNSEPITKVISAMTIGYHRPW